MFQYKINVMFHSNNLTVYTVSFIYSFKTKNISADFKLFQIV